MINDILPPNVQRNLLLILPPNPGSVIQGAEIQYGMIILFTISEKFEDTKDNIYTIIVKRKRTNNDVRNITQKTIKNKPIKIGSELISSGRTFVVILIL